MSILRVFHYTLLILLPIKLSSAIKFPDDFQFGVATASYQIEGGWDENGKGENIWDHLTHNHPEMIKDHSNGDIACDSYHKIKEDVKLLVDLGVDFYRFSLSWSRILPSGFSNHINPDGIRYYRELIDELTANNIKPVVTLFHWDLPQPLQEIGGWTNPLLADYYEDYARVVFDNLAHKVKYWITFNEPYEVCEEALALGNGAPVLFLKGIGDYLCAHTILKAHGRVYNLFKSKYKILNDGQMGITLNTPWYEPKTNSTEDIAAADRKQKMTLDWFAHPIYSKDGDYPTVMKQRVAIMSSEENFIRSRLPTFTQEEIQMIKGSYDFFGLNHYTTSLVSDSPNNTYPSPSHQKDIGVDLTTDPNWPGSASNWLKVVPWGMSKLLHYINREYNNPDVFITENGFSDHGELNDLDRINYYKTYLEEVAKAISEGCNVRAYAAWSLLDNFEWMEGYTQRFGLYYVDFTNSNRPRVAKQSSLVYKDIIKNHEVNFTYWPSILNEPQVNYIN